jgi:hypothetical protein
MRDKEEFYCDNCNFNDMNKAIEILGKLSFVGKLCWNLEVI